MLAYTVCTPLAQTSIDYTHSSNDDDVHVYEGIFTQ